MSGSNPNVIGPVGDPDPTRAKRGVIQPEMVRIVTGAAAGQEIVLTIAAAKELLVDLTEILQGR